MNDILKTLTSPGTDLNELIENHASQQTGTVLPATHFNFGKSNGQDQKDSKVYQKTRLNPSKRQG